MRSLIIDSMLHLLEADVNLLRSTDIEMEVETISDPDAARRRTQLAAEVDVVVYVIRSENLRDYALLRSLCHWAMGIPVIVLSVADNLDELLDVQECGAAGYVPLNLRRDVLTNVLRVLLIGGEYFPVWHYIKDRSDIFGIAADFGTSRAIAQLTRRQREVLDHLAKGLSNKQIAERLGMSSGTTRTHVAAVLRTLGVRNRLQATKLYLRSEQGL